MSNDPKFFDLNLEPNALQLRLAETEIGSGDYESALKRLLLLREQGSLSALVILGSLYRDGRGVENDIQLAKSYYEEAAIKGSITGKFYLGRLLYDIGDYANAYEWFKSSSVEEFIPSHYWLSKFYRYGLSVDKNIDLVKLHLEHAASRGHVFAKRDIAIMKMKGMYGALFVPIAPFIFFKAIVSGIFSAFSKSKPELLY